MRTTKPLMLLPLSERINSAEFDVNDAQQKKKDLYNAPLHANPESQKKVSFRQTATIDYTLALRDYSVEEKKTSWYSKTELADLKLQNKPTVTRMRAGETDLDTDQHCSRGLEHRVYDRHMQRKGLRLRAQTVVLEAQAVRNPEEIASCYSLACNASSFSAHQRGLRDELKASEPEQTDKIKADTSSMIQSINNTWALIQPTKGIEMKPETKWAASIFFHEYICGI